MMDTPVCNGNKRKNTKHFYVPGNKNNTNIINILQYSLLHQPDHIFRRDYSGYLIISKEGVLAHLGELFRLHLYQIGEPSRSIFRFQ